MVFEKPACPTLGVSPGDLQSTAPKQGPARDLPRHLQGLCCPEGHSVPPREVERVEGPHCKCTVAPAPRSVQSAYSGQGGDTEAYTAPSSPGGAEPGAKEKDRKISRYLDNDRRGPYRDMNKK